MSITFADELSAIAAAVAEYDQARAADANKRESRIHYARNNAVKTYMKSTAETRADIIEGLKGETMATAALARKIGRVRSTILRHLNDMAEEGVLRRGGTRAKPVWGFITLS